MWSHSILVGNEAHVANYSPLINYPETYQASVQTLLMHFEGANGSTSFVDATGRHVITGHGSAQLSTAQFKFGTSSLLLNGTTDYLSIDGSSDFVFGDGDFTIDCQVYPNVVSAQHAIFSWAPGTPKNFDLITNSTGLQFRVTSTAQISGGVMTALAWQHVAVTRASGTTRLFRNGVLIGSYADNNVYGVQAGGPNVGVSNTVFYFGGYIDELRIIKGRAAWTAAFTPPSAPYTP